MRRYPHGPVPHLFVHLIQEYQVIQTLTLFAVIGLMAIGTGLAVICLTPKDKD